MYAHNNTNKTVFLSHCIAINGLSDSPNFPTNTANNMCITQLLDWFAPGIRLQCASSNHKFLMREY